MQNVVISRPAPRATGLARAGQLEVRVAERPQEVDEALRLRYRVFASELGACLDGDAAGPEGSGTSREWTGTCSMPIAGT